MAVIPQEKENKMKNKIIETLIRRGYEAELKTVTKNNVKMDAVVMGSGTIRPTIYIDSIIENCTDVDKIVDRVIEIYESNINPNFCLDKILSLDFIAEHITIALQKTSDEDIVKKPTEFEGIEQYLLVQDKEFSYKLTSLALNTVGIDVTEAWDIAMDNLKAMTVFEPMAKVLAELSGMSEQLFDGLPIAVISNTYKCKGASAILNKEALQEYARANNTDKIYFIPSSIHEGIIIPGAYEKDIDDLTAMVKEVNSVEVDEVDQLADKAYVINI